MNVCSYPRVEHLRGVLVVYAAVLLINIRLDRPAKDKPLLLTLNIYQLNM
jgi:hypothetical protein